MTRPILRPPSSVAKICCQAALVSGSENPVSTAVQLGPSSSNHRLMWSSAKGSFMRSHKTPGAIGMTAPGLGGVVTGKCSGSGMWFGILN